jgi:hypothetical protein
VKTYKAGQPPSNPADVPGFLLRELSAIEQAAQRADPHALLQVLHAAPARVYAGMLIVADGTDFDPSALGTGEGLYRRNAANTAWVFVG